MRTDKDKRNGKLNSMKIEREIHPDFLFYLNQFDQNLIELYKDVRNFILEIHPTSNELLYQTHALTSVYTISEKLGSGYCHIPIYSAHLNIGFNKGALLNDVDQLLEGTGKLIRHIKVTHKKDYRNKKVKSLIKAAIKFAIEDMDKPSTKEGLTISKIK